MNSGDTRRAESILGSFEIKRLKINKERKNTEERL